MPNPESRRPEPGDRRFHSAAVETAMAGVCETISDPALAALFVNAFPNTLDTTVRHSPADADGRPDTFLLTGDIPAMWYRDSVCQIQPYLPLLSEDSALEQLVRGLVLRQAKCMRIDPFANSFLEDPEAMNDQRPDDVHEKRPGVWVRRYQLDSFGYHMRLAHAYWKAGGDPSCFDRDWAEAVDLLVDNIIRFQAGTDELPRPPYAFQRKAFEPFESLPLAGFGQPCRRTGMTRNFFRPSDDMCLMPFHVPANAMTVVGLRQYAEMLEAFELGREQAKRCRRLAGEIETAIHRHATVEHPVHGTILAYEVDGYGGRYLMDDANGPNLLGLPYFGFLERKDPLYRRTRAFVLSAANPYYVEGGELAGIGGPHVAVVEGRSGAEERGLGFVWPLGIIMQALTSDSEEEIRDCLRCLVRAGSANGFVPEAAWKDDVRVFRREWFAWANSFFGELVYRLWRERPGLLADFSM